jgi:ketosteroid isomerase-like protein
MAESNEDVVRSMYHAHSGKMDPNFAVLASDVEFHVSGAFPDLDGVYRGHDGVRTLTERLNEPWKEISLEPERIIEVDDERVVVLSHFRARGRDGIQVKLPFGHLWTLRRGKIVRMEAFADHQQALRAAGLDS